MGLGLKIRVWVAAGAVAAGLGLAAGAQTSIAITEPSTPLLPVSFGEWKTAPAGSGAVGTISLAAANKAALEECGPVRSAVADYARGGKAIHVEAVQFGDRTGAYSAFTLVRRPGMQAGTTLGQYDSVGEGAVLFMAGSSVVLVSGASAEDLAGLKPLADGLPKVMGSKGMAPLLPALVPARGLVQGSLRYALGAATYSAEGGVLPAASLGWDKNAEAVTAEYEDKRGKETLTLLLYPTPTIAGRFAREIENAAPQMGPKFAGAKVRREAEIVMLAEGTFSPDEAQRMLEDIHMKQQVSSDRDMTFALTPHEQVMQGASLFKSILILGGVLMLAAVVIGVFLGAGRAAYRMARGKPAAAEVEFLSLHLSPQNKAPKFTRIDGGERS
jgi:drug/metabolite transporter superfamily protein YnfA